MLADNSTFLFLTIGESAYLYSVDGVQEVAEMLPVRPYPISMVGHLGVINLRGEVIPVISFNINKMGKICDKNKCRLIICKDEDGRFAFACSSVKKVILSEQQIAEVEKSKITQVEGKPAMLLSISELLNRGAA